MSQNFCKNVKPKILVSTFSKMTFSEGISADYTLNILGGKSGNFSGNFLGHTDEVERVLLCLGLKQEGQKV
jgi:hypothetical protein